IPTTESARFAMMLFAHVAGSVPCRSGFYDNVSCPAETSAISPSNSSGYCASIAEKFALFDNLNDLGRHHFLPAFIARFQFGQDRRGINSQEIFPIVGDLFDRAIADQVLKKRAQIRRALDLFRGENFSRLLVDYRINVKFQTAGEHSAERFQNSAFEVEVIFFVKDLDQTWHAHHQTDSPVRVTRKITGEPIIFAELRDQNGPAKRAKNVHARQKIGVIELAFGEQVLQSHLHQHDEIFFQIG